jgi:hypothetical protein
VGTPTGIGGPTWTPTHANPHLLATGISYAGRAQLHHRYLTHVGYPTGSNTEHINYGIGGGAATCNYLRMSAMWFQPVSILQSDSAPSSSRSAATALTLSSLITHHSVLSRPFYRSSQKVHFTLLIGLARLGRHTRIIT